METCHDRLRALLLAASIPHRRLSTAAGLSGAAVRNLLNRRSDIELSTAQAIAEALGVSLEWLASGNGPSPNVSAVRVAVVAALVARGVEAPESVEDNSDDAEGPALAATGAS